MHHLISLSRSVSVKVLVLVVVSGVLGVGSAALCVSSAGMDGAVRNGAWSTNLLAGSAGAGMYVRAAISWGGLFALSKEETIYYTAFEDDSGEALEERCDYVLSGADLDARWWSMTLYGADHYLVPNKEQRYSYNLANLQRSQDRSYSVHLSASQRQGNWLPTAGAGAFSVTLRLYNPGKTVYEHPTKVRLPTITRGACR